MQGIFNFPVRADGFGRTGRGNGRVRDVEGGLGGVAQQSGFGVAGVDGSLDLDDGGDVWMPVGIGQRVGGIEDGDGAALIAVAAPIMAVGRPERSRGGRNLSDLPVQGRLVVLDPDDQRDVGCCRDL